MADDGVDYTGWAVGSDIIASLAKRLQVQQKKWSPSSTKRGRCDQP
jgi:hypothetical protein